MTPWIVALVIVVLVYWIHALLDQIYMLEKRLERMTDSRDNWRDNWRDIATLRAEKKP